MPRNGSGVYSLPSGSVVANGDTSDASDLNTPLADIASDLNTARPIAAGGTGATSASAARTALGLAIGTDVQAYSADLATYVSAPLTAAELAQLQNIGTVTISAAQWGYLGDISSFGASIIDDPDAAAVRGTLGLGTASVEDVGTAAGDLVQLDGSARLPAVDGSLLTNIPAIGVGQTWQDVTGSRAASTSYQNTTGRPIEVAIVAVSTQAAGRDVEISDDDATWIRVGYCTGSAGGQAPTSFIVPDNWYYRINGAVASLTWAELR